MVRLNVACLLELCIDAVSGYIQYYYIYICLQRHLQQVPFTSRGRLGRPGPTRKRYFGATLMSDIYLIVYIY